MHKMLHFFVVAGMMSLTKASYIGMTSRDDYENYTGAVHWVKRSEAAQREIDKIDARYSKKDRFPAGQIISRQEDHDEKVKETAAEDESYTYEGKVLLHGTKIDVTTKPWQKCQRDELTGKFYVMVDGERWMEGDEVTLKTDARWIGHYDSLRRETGRIYKVSKNNSLFGVKFYYGNREPYYLMKCFINNKDVRKRMDAAVKKEIPLVDKLKEYFSVVDDKTMSHAQKESTRHEKIKEIMKICKELKQFAADESLSLVEKISLWRSFTKKISEKPTKKETFVEVRLSKRVKYAGLTEKSLLKLKGA